METAIIVLFFTVITYVILYFLVGFDPFYINVRLRFRTRFADCWYSTDYVYLKYTNSYGIFWSSVYDGISQDVMWHTYEAAVETLSANNLKYLEFYKSKFTTVELCREQNSKINKEVAAKNKQRKENNKKSSQIVENNKRLINKL